MMFQVNIEVEDVPVPPPVTTATNPLTPNDVPASIEDILNDNEL